MIPVARVGDTVVGYCRGDGHTTDREFVGVWTTGSSTVFADNIIEVVRIGDIGITDCGHTFVAATGAETVFADNIGVHRVGDTVITEGGGVGVSTTGSDTVFADDVIGRAVTVPVSIDHVIDAVMSGGDELDDGTPAGAAAIAEHIQRYVDSGIIKQSDLDKPVVAGNTDAAPPANTAVSGDCQGFGEMTTVADNFYLTQRVTIGDVTKRVTFPHQVVPNKGLSISQITCNLKLLVINCWEPIKGHFPNAFITCSFRPGANEKQHGDGCAMDIQFTGAKKSDYFAIAQWIKANVTFDRLLLEYKTTGTGLPWIHISFTQHPSHLVFTFLNGRKYADHLVDLAAT